MLAETATVLAARAKEWKLWHYTPSLPAAIIFLVIFLALSILHTWTMFRARLWFCTALVVGGYMEVIGYIGRMVSRSNQTSLGPFTIQAMFLLIPPSVFAASLYMVLGRLIHSLGPKAEAMSLVRTSRLTKIFVAGDVLSFLVQGAGAGLMSIGLKWVDRGSNIVIVGLVVQVVFFGMFVVTAGLFHSRYAKAEKQQQQQQHQHQEGGTAWRTMLNMLYVTSGLILLRSVFRIVEYGMGFTGYPMVHEWTLYIFDSVPMAAVMVVFWWWYPSMIRGSGLSVPSSVVLGEVEQV